ncbi:Threonine-phosphate decarboxylase [uncultured Blautia sp.]
MKHIHGGNVYQYQNCVDFSANCNPLGTPESVKNAIIESLSHINDYPQVGCAPLKEAIAQYEGVEKSEVICGNGAAELIFSLCRALKPKKALLPAPTFAEYEQALASVDCSCSHFFLKEEQDFFMDDSFLKEIAKEFNIIFLCNPNNPTGILTKREFLVKVLEKCREHSVFLVVDECFLDFVKEPESYTLKGVLKEYPNLFLLKAFTKRYAMAGVRLGYGLTANRELLEKMESVTQPWNVSSLAQAAGLAALKEREYVKQGRETVFREQEFLKKEMKALGFQVFPSEANYIFFKGEKNLFEKCVEKGILIRDCSNYPGLKSGFFRIAVKSHEDNKTLLRVLKEIERG